MHTPPHTLCHNQQEVKGSIDLLQGPVEEALARREEMVSRALPLEGQRIQETATLLSTNWDKLNKLYQDRLKYGKPHLYNSAYINDYMNVESFCVDIEMKICVCVCVRAHQGVGRTATPSGKSLFQIRRRWTSG